MARKTTIVLVLAACLLTVSVASVYAKGGNPFDELLILITSADERVNILEARIDELEGLVADIPDLRVPDFDSGWMEITCSENIDLDLGFEITDNLFVYILGRGRYTSGGWTYHQFHFGGNSEWKRDLGRDYNYGLDWAMGGAFGEVLRVHRMPQDMNWEQVRVMVWQLPS